MLEDSRLVLATLALCVVASELLARRTPLRHLGSALVVIVVAAILSNLGVIPAASTPERPVPVYDAVFEHVAPLAIFWLVLRVDLRRTLAAGVPLLAMFGLGAAGTVLGVLVGFAWLGADAFGPSTAALSGMFAATYIGGSANFNALALHYEVVRDGTLYAGTMAVDAGLTAVWMVVTIAVPRLAARGRSATAEAGVEAGVDAASSQRAASESQDPSRHDLASVDPLDLATLLTVGVGALWLTDAIVDVLAGWGLAVPGMLVLTTLALALAQVPALAKVAGANLLGMLAVQVFLATIGAFCDLGAVASLGPVGLRLLAFASVTIAIHGALTFGVARLLRFDAAVAAVASQANIGGGTTALALARSIGRRDLVVPGILVGALGTALGTFVGFAVAAGLAP